MLGLPTGLQGMAIAGGVALVVGGVTGWKTRDAFCDSAAAKRELAQANAAITALQVRIEAVNAAAAGDQVRASAAEAAMSEMKETADALESAITDGACFGPGADADRVRQLWRGNPGRKREPAASAK